jgi:hypothetical protein
MRAATIAGFFRGGPMRNASARHSLDGSSGGSATQPDEHSVLRQLRDERRLSSGNDSCQHEVARVNSISLHKGITVERRRRKASGPTGARAQDSGVAGGDFITKRPSSPSTILYLLRISCSASASSPCDEAALRAIRLRVASADKEEQRKLKWANPSKDGDAKPPVCRISQQRGSNDSGVAA